MLINKHNPNFIVMMLLGALLNTKSAQNHYINVHMSPICVNCQVMTNIN
jgi:hypothetical protein